ncbi:MAG: hypothetical protein EOO48_07405 [Flavobacterium sp.]|nr:MAG: hypothetical protein EOO48_07405 [Flavobacterium sp.]
MKEITIETAAFGSDSLKLKIGRKNLGCFVLGNGLAVISTDSIPKALGYDGKSANWLFEFLMGVNRLTPIEPALLESLGRPIRFQIGNSDAIRFGISADVFMEACEAILRAKDDGFLYVSELRFAKAASEILNHLDGKNLADEIAIASGYNLFKQNHKQALARKMSLATMSNYPVWVMAFTDDFYQMLLQFKSWEWTDLNNSAEQVGEYLNDIIFSRIDSALLENLETTRPKKKYRKNGIPEHYVQHQGLEEYVLALSALIKASAMNHAIFEQLINKSFPRKRELVVEKLQAKAKIPAATNPAFDETLAKAFRKKT